MYIVLGEKTAAKPRVIKHQSREGVKGSLALKMISVDKESDVYDKELSQNESDDTTTQDFMSCVSSPPQLKELHEQTSTSQHRY